MKTERRLVIPQSLERWHHRPIETTASPLTSYPLLVHTPHISSCRWPRIVFPFFVAVTKGFIGAFQPLPSVVQSYRGMIINYHYSQYDYYVSTGLPAVCTVADKSAPPPYSLIPRLTRVCKFSKWSPSPSSPCPNSGFQSRVSAVMFTSTNTTRTRVRARMLGSPLRDSTILHSVE